MNREFPKNTRGSSTEGFTLVELLVALAIVALLSTIVYAGFGDARAQTRDKSRMTALKDLQLAIELYKAQNGQYPEGNCGATYASNSFIGPGPRSGTVANLLACVAPYTTVDRATYIKGLIPDFVSTLPEDVAFEFQNDKGFYYRSNGASYKLMIRDSVETLTISSYDDEFARCPKANGTTCPAAIDDVTSRTYAVYSLGAEDW